jgi:hypothetical protein
MKARHILFGGIFFMLGVVFQSIINFLFPQGSFTKYSLLIMGGFILFSTLAYLWKSSILDSKPSAFIWIVIYYHRFIKLCFHILSIFVMVLKTSFHYITKDRIQAKIIQFLFIDLIFWAFCIDLY